MEAPPAIAQRQRPARALRPPPPLDPAATALFTDLDGTLAPIEARPGLVGPDAARRRLLQDLGDKQVRRRGRLGDLALGRQTVARASQVDEAADGVVDLSKEVHVGPIMQRAWSRDEQLLAATLGWEFPVVLRGGWPATTTR